jgi:hypothetical protein
MYNQDGETTLFVSNMGITYGQIEQITFEAEITVCRTIATMMDI